VELLIGVIDEIFFGRHLDGCLDRTTVKRLFI
jgi:hypothetical protein